MWNMIFWYLFLLHFGVPNGFAAVLLIPTLISFIMALRSSPPSFGWKVFLYAWFVCMMVTWSVIYFRLNSLDFFFTAPMYVRLLDPIGVTLNGAAFLYIFVQALFILLLIPLPDKHQTYASRIKEVRKHALMLSTGYADTQVHHTQLLLASAGLSGVLWANFHTRWIPDGLLVSLLIVLSANSARLPIHNKNKQA